MTRFARAKGSKASNERIPNESTPWSIMKEQLEQCQSVKQDANKRVKSARELLTEKDDLFYYDSTGNVNIEWAQFEDPGSKDKINTVANGRVEAKKIKKTKNKKLKKAIEVTERNESAKPDEIVLNECVQRKVTKKLKRGNESSKTVKENSAISTNTEKVETSSTTCAKIKNRKSMPKFEDVGVNASIGECQLSNEKNDKETNINVNQKKLTKRQKRNQKKLKRNVNLEESIETRNEDSTGHFNLDGNDWNSNVKFGKQRKMRNKNNTRRTSGEESNITPDLKTDEANKPFKNKRGMSIPSGNLNNIQGPQKKYPKIRDEKEHKRRKPDPGIIKVTVEGREIEIMNYDGFPVKKEDAERLKELKQKMILKGIPAPEVKAAMKLERRRAEKALAREKKRVCFHCRKSGHNLSDCPELGREEIGTGICFKCGSTEHTHFECKVTKGQEFGFARCFICREQGHIAKQCPDNPKGLYPQGGACKICGDVTHLKKDCPDLNREKEETTITLDKIDDNTLELLDQDIVKRKSTTPVERPKNKVVKF